jgi:fatty-acyl-CoA synthase
MPIQIMMLCNLEVKEIKVYTYKSFLDEVDSLATCLIELGFEKGDRIGVWLPNTSESCAMTYATLELV